MEEDLTISCRYFPLANNEDELIDLKINELKNN